ncbi:MAG: substrate-binding domain-containing protein [Pirellulales bacterium]|nr:substrate-binding domain-containing protein [Pirellulales bacterium]
MKHRSGSVRSLGFLLLVLAVTGCGGTANHSDLPRDRGTLRIGLMPKLIGIAYFTACNRGAQEAAAELGVEVTYDGPPVDKVEEQNKIVDRWVAQEFDVIAVAPNDPEVIAEPLRLAREEGVVTLTWDADANPTSSQRQLFVNQAPIELVGFALVDVLGEAIGGEGKTVIITGSATSPNQNAWMTAMHRRLAHRYPKITLLETLVSDEDQGKAAQLARDVLAAHPDLRGIWGITSMALPGAAKAVRDAGRSGQVIVTGLGLPNVMREYVKDGTVPRFVLWNAEDLGYLTVHVGARLARGELPPGRHDFGRLQQIEVTESEVILGPPVVFDRANIDQYDF